MEIKHIYWFAYYNLDEPSVRYRAKFPLQQLKDKHGITFSLVYPGYDFKHVSNFLSTFLSALFFRKPHSVIVFQKIYSTGLYATALKVLLFFRPRHTLYDIDDAEHTRRPAHTIYHFMRNCSACSTGSKSLLDYTRQFNRNTFLMTSPVIDHGFIKNQLESRFTVGWIGYYGAHRQSLTELFFPALHKISFPLHLIILGVEDEAEVCEIQSIFRSNPNITVDAPLGLDWHDEPSIYKIICTFDIGVSPLIDNEFNRGKSAFKLKQCLSCGIPVLASRVGENNAFISHGENGYFCDTPDEYFAKINSLKISQGIFSDLTLNAKNTFPSFSIDEYCSIFLNYFKDAYTKEK